MKSVVLKSNKYEKANELCIHICLFVYWGLVHIYEYLCVCAMCTLEEKIETKNVNHLNSMEKVRREWNGIQQTKEYQLLLQYDRVKLYVLYIIEKSL